MRKVLALACLAALSAAPILAQEARLIAVTGVDRLNNGTLTEIDPLTGTATMIQPFAVPRGAVTGPIAWHDPSASLLMLWPNTNGDGGYLTQMSPGAGVLGSGPITGLPAGQTGLGGLAYDAGRDRVLITFGPTGSGLPDRVAELDLSGAVRRITASLGIGVRDAISVQEFTGDLLLCDFDGPSPRVVAGRDLFTTPSFTTLGDPPAEPTILDVATDPFHLPVFAVENATNTLLTLNGNAFTTVGPLGTGEPINGLEAITCQLEIGLGNSSLELNACGGTLMRGSPAVMTLFPIPPGAPCALLFGGNGTPLPLPPPWSGTLVPNPVLFSIPVVPQQPGFFAVPLVGGGGPFALAVQAVCADLGSQQILLSNALLLTVFG